jgi:hypothetical protein
MSLASAFEISIDICGSAPLGGHPNYAYIGKAACLEPDEGMIMSADLERAGKEEIVVFSR